LRGQGRRRVVEGAPRPPAASPPLRLPEYGVVPPRPGGAGGPLPARRGHHRVPRPHDLQRHDRHHDRPGRRPLVHRREQHRQQDRPHHHRRRRQRDHHPHVRQFPGGHHPRAGRRPVVHRVHRQQDRPHHHGGGDYRRVPAAQRGE